MAFGIWRWVCVQRKLQVLRKSYMETGSVDVNATNKNMQKANKPAVVNHNETKEFNDIEYMEKISDQLQTAYTLLKRVTTDELNGITDIYLFEDLPQILRVIFEVVSMLLISNGKYHDNNWHHLKQRMRQKDSFLKSIINYNSERDMSNELYTEISNVIDSNIVV